MKTQQESIARPATGSVALRTGTSPAPASARTSTLPEETLERLRGDAPRFMAMAPGRLDVLAGLSDYAGALTLTIPLVEYECVAVQRRTDGKIMVMPPPSTSGNGEAAIQLPAAQLLQSDGKGPASAMTDSLISLKPTIVRCMVGALAEGMRRAILPPLSDGLTLTVGSMLSELSDAGRWAALSAATLSSAAAAYGASMDLAAAASACQLVYNDWLNMPVGVSDALCSLRGEAKAVNQWQSEPISPVGVLALPERLRVVGVDSGVCHDASLEKYRAVRTTTSMGRVIIQRIVEHEHLDHVAWEAGLSRISLTDYVDHFRDRLPTKLKGNEFLKLFGETGDRLSRVEADVLYKVRSRTEHHIYEHARACQWVECLSRAIRLGDDRALREAGDLMYASHWSYGQRCGLGSVEADLLVNLIRRHGEYADIFGAKITGRGCGGVIAILLKSTDQAQEALQNALADYAKATGRKANLLTGSTPGCLVSGVRKL